MTICARGGSNNYRTITEEASRVGDAATAIVAVDAAGDEGAVKPLQTALDCVRHHSKTAGTPPEIGLDASAVEPVATRQGHATLKAGNKISAFIATVHGRDTTYVHGGVVVEVR